MNPEDLFALPFLRAESLARRRPSESDARRRTVHVAIYGKIRWDPSGGGSLIIMEPHLIYKKGQQPNVGAP